MTSVYEPAALLRFRAAFSSAAKAVRLLGDAVSGVVETIARVFGASPARLDYEARQRACDIDGLWQTEGCATWIHATCVAPGRCDCRCHGGSLW